MGLGYGIVYLVAPNISPIMTIIGMVVVFFCTGTYALAALLNPGIATPEANDINEDELEPENNTNYCEICHLTKERYTDHCMDCGVCILEMDHHCPWTSKCVGKGNLKWFYCFLFGLVGMIVYVVMCLTISSKEARMRH